MSYGLNDFCGNGGGVEDRLKRAAATVEQQVLSTCSHVRNAIPEMALRDFFAACCAIGWHANSGANCKSVREIAADVYEAADAMLAERSKNQ